MSGGSPAPDIVYQLTIYSGNEFLKIAYLDKDYYPINLDDRKCANLEYIQSICKRAASSR
jgi:hypothetical protein